MLPSQERRHPMPMRRVVPKWISRGPNRVGIRPILSKLFQVTEATGTQRLITTS